MRQLVVGFVFLTGMILVWAGRADVALAHDVDQNFPGLVKRIEKSIVGIAIYHPLNSPRIQLRGTGFAVSEGRHIVTNAHVLPEKSRLKPGEKIVVLVGEGQNPDVRDVEIIDRDDKHDVALLKIAGGALPKLALGTGALQPAGTAVAFTGYPIGAVLGLYPVTHQGIISSVTPIVIPQPSARYLDVQIITQPRFDVYQLDATAYPGNSGSPVYNIYSGRVEGIINSVKVKGTKENALSQPSGISYAIPVVYIHNMLAKAGLSD
ncbi:S1 family peptidase [Luteithermobacter gelatinilyticus]|uniref:S1 family peptidase n=1 Tax=Luteithermobacter gelatinilyticus TaxID=2582913 RepID=UPI00143D52A6|nr:serine protease [Luteithermobacter gelatinilyticus]